ncbi:MAG: SpoVR family protein [Spirochaetota bacterium]|nr:SpoVR family protein [Spirochaetota bacterium]
MSRNWTNKELEDWGKSIEEKVEEIGLNCYPQDFIIADHYDMLTYMTFNGMPTIYPHWSWGKHYEITKTLYDYGITGLPYELVINSNPCIAYLMKDNTLLLQILTMAHVYAHNDFFRNNFIYKSTVPSDVVSMFNRHANRIQKYIEDPSIGVGAVEKCIDSLHSIRYNCSRLPEIKEETHDKQIEKKTKKPQITDDPFADIHTKEEKAELPDMKKVPIEPIEDIMIFIRDHNPYLSEWEKDIFTIVRETTNYFLPNIHTKIMNEGWASLWHKRIIDELDLSQELYQEFLVQHNRVVSPVPGRINPYYIGIKIWEDIFKRWDNPSNDEKDQYKIDGNGGLDKIFEVRECDRDASFIRRFLTDELIRELLLFTHKKNDQEDVVITKVADENSCEHIRNSLIKSTGLESYPVIKIEDANFWGTRTLFLKHYPIDEGEELDMDFAQRTLDHIAYLWQGMTILETSVKNEKRIIQSKKE